MQAASPTPWCRAIRGPAATHAHDPVRATALGGSPKQAGRLNRTTGLLNCDQPGLAAFVATLAARRTRERALMTQVGSHATSEHAAFRAPGLQGGARHAQHFSLPVSAMNGWLGWMMEKASEVTVVDLYLMQRGQATIDTENPERPLTRGRAGGCAASRCPGSGRGRAGRPLRAQWKAPCGADRAFVGQRDRRGLQRRGSSGSCAGRPGRADCAVAPWGEQHQALALVGHLPCLDRLASLLVAGARMHR
jgi:hypothetical protein